MQFIKRVLRKNTTKKMNSSKSGFAEFTPGPPNFAVVKPGFCQFTPDFQRVPLKSKVQVSPDTFVFTFATPDGMNALNLPTCACILARGGRDKDGNPVVRPYTPCSTNSMKGQFMLMIKIYPDGIMTQYLRSLNVGDEVEFKHIEFNVKIQYPFGKKFVGMIIGGTGITPMIQALHALLGNPDDETEIHLLYGSRTSDNILAKDTLDNWTKLSQGRLQVTYVLSHEPEERKKTLDPSFKFGFITKSLIETSFPSSNIDGNSENSDVIIFVCGPPVMYDLFSGPRDDKTKVTGILGELGYSTRQVYKF